MNATWWPPWQRWAFSISYRLHSLVLPCTFFLDTQGCTVKHWDGGDHYGSLACIMNGKHDLAVYLLTAAQTYPGLDNNPHLSFPFASNGRMCDRLASRFELLNDITVVINSTSHARLPVGFMPVSHNTSPFSSEGLVDPGCRAPTAAPLSLVAH